MKPILVLYATRQGHARRIADYLAAAVQKHDFSAEIVDAGKLPEGFLLDAYSGAWLTASVYGGRHEPEMIEFVKLHLAGLERIPNAFLSVSLSEAGAKDPKAPAEQRSRAAADVQRMIDAFLNETGWRPKRIQPVAGALLYTKYNFVMRFIMKHIVRNATGATDTSKDYVYTDWTALDRFVDASIEAIPAEPMAAG